MPRIFVSHASDDGQYVEDFVSYVLQLACEIPNGDLFYSSGSDTGVPAGADLMSWVRQEVAGANLVVALITPTYLTRPVCMAELGAAWGVAGHDKLFPLLAPGMSRRDLEGILPSLLIRYSDEEEALEQLHTRVGQAVGLRSQTSTWGRHVRKWKSAVGELAGALPTPPVASIARVTALEKKIVDSEEIIDSMEAQIVDLERKLALVSALKDSNDVAEVSLPSNQGERLDLLAKQAAKALRVLHPIVREAVRCDALGNEMEWPRHIDDEIRYREARVLLDDGDLIEGTADDLLKPAYAFPNQRAARDAVHALMEFIDEEAEPLLFEVFEANEGLPLDIRKRKVWTSLLTP